MAIAIAIIIATITITVIAISIIIPPRGGPELAPLLGDLAAVAADLRAAGAQLLG